MCDIISEGVWHYSCENVQLNLWEWLFFCQSVSLYLWECDICVCDNISVCVILYLRECDICLCATFPCLCDNISLSMWHHYISSLWVCEFLICLWVWHLCMFEILSLSVWQYISVCVTSYLQECDWNIALSVWSLNISESLTSVYVCDNSSVSLWHRIW